LEFKDISLYFIVGVVFIIASWLLGYVLQAVLYPLWLVAATGGQLQFIAAVILAFCVVAIVTGWLVLEVAKKIGGLR